MVDHLRFLLLFLLFIFSAKLSFTSPAHSSAVHQLQVVKTPACKTGEKSQDVFLSNFFIWQILNHDLRKIVVDSQKVCLRFKNHIKVLSTKNKKPILEIQIDKIFAIEGAEGMKSHLSAQAMLADQIIRQENNEPNSPYAVFSFKIKTYLETDRRDFTQVFTGSTPYAQRINRSRAAAILQSGAFVGLTVTKKESLKTSFFKNASPLYWQEVLGGFTFDDLNEKPSGAATTLSGLPKKKNYPVLLMGLDQYDHRPLIASYELARRGYTNLYFFEGGLRAWKNPGERLPKNYPGVKFLNAGQTLQKNHNAATLVDVRKQNLSTEGSLSGAKNIPYIEDTNSPRAKNIFSESLLSDDFDLNQLPFSKKTEVVFFGVDSNDWAPLKAAIKARNAGYKKVFVFRGGFSQWKYYNQKHPRRFSVKSL